MEQASGPPWTHGGPDVSSCSQRRCWYIPLLVSERAKCWADVWTTGISSRPLWPAQCPRLGRCGREEELAACALPWQMLPLQTRPLLRIGDDVVVLDEPFLLEAVTTGLYWRVSDHVRKDDPEAWKPWSVAYAEMIEALAEEMVEALAPVLLGIHSPVVIGDPTVAAV